VFSGYKLFGPHGSFLYGRKEAFESLEPYKVAPAHENIPFKWEWGTKDQAKFAAIRGVMDHLEWLADQVWDKYRGKLTEYSGRKRSLKVAMDAIEKYETELAKAVLVGFDGVKGLAALPQVKVYGLTDLNRLNERDPTFAFKVKNMPDNEVVARLWSEGAIASRAEDFYSRALKSYNQKTMIRISLVHHNTLEEVGTFLRTMNKICES
jgi:selenocysteine lyase/cysteine desulfurase